MSKRPDILPCKCGRTPTLRYRMPYSWIECKCGRSTKMYADFYEQVDPDAVRSAINEWNKKIQGENNV